MASIAAKMVMFSILVNLAASITMLAVVDIDGNRVFDATAQGGYIFEGEAYSDDFTTQLEETIRPSGALDDKGDQIYRVLDTMSLGFIYKFLNVVDTYMFGFINMLDNTIGQYLADDVRVIMFGNDDNNDLVPNKLGAFKIILTISYILMGLSFFTGKNMVEE